MKKEECVRKVGVKACTVVPSVVVDRTLLPDKELKAIGLSNQQKPLLLHNKLGAVIPLWATKSTPKSIAGGAKPNSMIPWGSVR